MSLPKMGTVMVEVAGVPVPLPSGTFLQATHDGEQALVGAVREWLGGAGQVADLFSGLGTFAFAMAGPAQVLAAEAGRDAVLACKAAAARSRGCWNLRLPAPTETSAGLPKSAGTSLAALSRRQSGVLILAMSIEDCGMGIDRGGSILAIDDLLGIDDAQRESFAD